METIVRRKKFVLKIGNCMEAGGGKTLHILMILLSNERFNRIRHNSGSKSRSGDWRNNLC